MQTKTECADDEWQAAEVLPGGIESRRSREGYTSDVATCLESLRAGESYELCLTTKLRKRGRIDAKNVYSRLRASNPSAHAAWLNLGRDLPTVGHFCFNQISAIWPLNSNAWMSNTLPILKS